MIQADIFFFALLGGILPALLWLSFWLREDRLHPEPRTLIMLSFLSGMATAAGAVPFEQFIADQSFSLATVIIWWAVVEEVLKYLGAYVTALRKKACNEPIDVLIYLVSTALGFAALENTLFLLAPISSGDVFKSIVTGNLRFVGATLLHVITSGALGVFLAAAFYQSRKKKWLFLFLGLLAAVAIHAAFNIGILKAETNQTFIVFIAVWATVIALLVAFEKIKRIRRAR